MFIRTKKTPRSKSISVQLVESFRVDGKNKQRVIRHFGTADTSEKLEALKLLAESMKVNLEHEQLRTNKPREQDEHLKRLIGELQEVRGNTTISASSLQELDRHILGIHDIYGYIYDQLGFANPFYNPARRIYAAKILREIVLARIAIPNSKRASVALLEKRFGVAINLDHVYQMMDKIDDKFCNNIQDISLATTLKLIKGKLRILFYDATTLYFESFTEDELKQNGYSKDMKFNQPQVLLALFVAEHGLPVGYELFPGATYEGHTLVYALEKLKRRYQIEQIVFVADRGLLNEDNIKYLEENNFNYIVGARIKNLSQDLKDKILDKDNYKAITEDDQKIAIFGYGNKRQLIVSYSKVRAQKDYHDRQKAIEKLRKKLNKSKDPKSLLSNYGYKKYLKIDGDINLNVNEEKFKEDEKWDGLLGVITNISGILPKELLVHYKSLWQIEECFRINKHDLKLRPIYHWTPDRIKAHIAISFIAFVCTRYLEYRLSLQSQKLSPEVIRDSLMQVQASVIYDGKSGRKFLLPSKVNQNAREIYRILRIRVPEKMMDIK